MLPIHTHMCIHVGGGGGKKKGGGEKRCIVLNASRQRIQTQQHKTRSTHFSSLPERKNAECVKKSDIVIVEDELIKEE